MPGLVHFLGSLSWTSHTSSQDYVAATYIERSSRIFWYRPIHTTCLWSAGVCGFWLQRYMISAALCIDTKTDCEKSIFQYTIYSVCHVHFGWFLNHMHLRLNFLKLCSVQVAAWASGTSPLHLWCGLPQLPKWPLPLWMPTSQPSLSDLIRPPIRCDLSDAFAPWVVWRPCQPMPLHAKDWLLSILIAGNRLHAFE